MLIVEVYNQTGELVWMVEFAAPNTDDLIYFLGEFFSSPEYHWFAYSPISSANWN